jgi:hypothetical protein
MPFSPKGHHAERRRSISHSSLQSSRLLLHAKCFDYAQRDGLVIFRLRSKQPIGLGTTNRRGRGAGIPSAALGYSGRYCKQLLNSELKKVFSNASFSLCTRLKSIESENHDI